MALYTKGTTIPELENTTAIKADDLMIIHDGLTAKKTNVERLKEAIVEDVEQNLADEIDRAIDAESTLTINLNAEISRAEGVEDTLAKNLSAEIDRAKGAEGSNTSKITDEETRAKNAENTLTTNLNAEITRAKNAEASITASVTGMWTVVHTW